MIKYPYKSLEDFLRTNPLNVDGELNDGWGAFFPVKGIEIEATILFADITSFSGRTYDLSPIETLIFVNNFFSWISAEALRNNNGIIDKYIGDEIMVVFANEFGSEDHFVDALRTARYMMERDSLSFMPHIGISSGKVVIGYVGTPLHYNCSVFGTPVSIAARCASVKSNHPKAIVFPKNNWNNMNIDELFPPIEYVNPDGSIDKQDQLWEIQESKIVEMKNIPDTEIMEITSDLVHWPQKGATERAKDCFSGLKKNGFYRQFTKIK